MCVIRKLINGEEVLKSDLEALTDLIEETISSSSDSEARNHLYRKLSTFEEFIIETPVFSLVADCTDKGIVDAYKTIDIVFNGLVSIDKSERQGYYIAVTNTHPTVYPAVDVSSLAQIIKSYNHPYKTNVLDMCIDAGYSLADFENNQPIQLQLVNPTDVDFN